VSNDIFFDDRRFISAGNAAQAAGVTRDYIGRLCREDKVVGRRVGKLWYVEESSLSDFLVNKSYLNEQRRQKLSAQRVEEYKKGSLAHGSYDREKKIKTTSIDNYFKPTGRRVESAKEMVARSVNVMNDTARQASLHAATVATHKAPVHEIADFGQRASALFLAFMLTFGTYAFVDAQYARFAKESFTNAYVYTKNSPGRIAHAVDLSNPENAFKQVAATASTIADDPSGKMRCNGSTSPRRTPASCEPHRPSSINSA